MTSQGGAALRRRPLQALVAFALAAVVLMVPSTPVGAATMDAHPRLVQCFTDFPPAGCSALGPDGFTAADAAISPEGRHLYVLGSDATVLIVDRSDDGTLTPRTGDGSCVDADGDGGCTAVPGLLGDEAADLDVSPDGNSLYVATGRALVNLDRNPETGDLAANECFSTDVEACTHPSFFMVPTAVAVSPDSLDVYARSDGMLAAFSRNLTTGELTVKPLANGCYAEVGFFDCSDLEALAGTSTEMAVSADGFHLYVPGSNGVAVLFRGTNGGLAQVAGPEGGCLTADGSSSAPDECQSLGATGPAMVDAQAVSVSPSGEHVFIAGPHGSLAFARQDGLGALTLTDCVEGHAGTIPGCQDVDGANGQGVEVSPDGTMAIVGGEDIAGFGMYAFDEATGQLTQLPSPGGCWSGSGATGCTPIQGGVAGRTVWAPDGLNAYVLPSGSLLNLRQDYAPVCQSASVTVPMNTPTTIPLVCSDANGDPITMSTPVLPQAGTLGSVDQVNDVVVYTPAAGYSGNDSFSFGATDGDRTSALATVSVTIPGPSPPPTPTWPSPSPSPSPPASPSPDKTVTLTVTGGKIKLTDNGKAPVRLTCPAVEPSGPCTGKLTMKTRGKVLVGDKVKVVVLGGGTYTLKAGASKLVALELSAKSQKLVRKVADARKLRLVAKVKDTAGNAATIKKLATLTLP